MSTKQTVSGTWLISVLEQFEAQHIPISALADAPWLLEASERNPTRPLQMLAVRRIWHQATKCVDDPLLGIRVGLNLSLQAVNVIAWIAIHSPTLRQSLTHSIRYQSLISNSGTFELEPDGEGLCVNYRIASAPVPMHPAQIDSVFAGLLRLLRTCRSNPLKPELVALPGAQPQWRTDYENLLQCTVVESSKTPHLKFSAADLDKPYSAADPHLLQMAIRRAQDLVQAQHRTESLVDHVRAMIDAQGVAKASCQSVADAMNMSVRTLQRRLEACGTHFRRLLEATRMEQALRLLADSQQPLSSIAEILGYSDQSGLSHAVRAHWGSSPRELREEMIMQYKST